MNSISNIWNHPKTSAAGLLIGVVTIASVLSQQGITLGAAGNGSMVTLASGLATALLGLLARDPVSSTSNVSSSNSVSSTAKFGCWALIALLLPLPFMSGCTGIGVAQNIVNWTPTLQSAVATVNSTATLLAPQDAPIFAAATAGFDAASNELAAQAKAYLANPNASVLAQLQTAVVTFQQQVNASLLQAARITNPASQQRVLNAINGVATVVSAMLALVVSVSSKAAVARMAAQSKIKLAEVKPYSDPLDSVLIVAQHYDGDLIASTRLVEQGEIALTRAGF